MERPVFGGVLLSDRDDGPLLALRRHHLGISVSSALSGGSKLMTEEHIVEKKTYYSVFAALMALLITTIGVAYIHLGELNIIVALSIAFIKAALIALYFMHIRYSSRLLWVFAGAGLFWLGIMFALAFADYLTRGLVSPPAGWQ
jgi:cytochrome c oxidase subunit 4